MAFPLISCRHVGYFEFSLYNFYYFHDFFVYLHHKLKSKES